MLNLLLNALIFASELLALFVVVLMFVALLIGVVQFLKAGDDIPTRTDEERDFDNVRGINDESW